MNQIKTGFISLLLLCQFCASAQNWLAVGGGAMPPAISIHSFYLDSSNNRLIACAHMGATTRSLQYSSTNDWDSLGSLSPAVPTQYVNYRGTVYGASGYGVYELNGSTWQPFALSHNAVDGFFVNDTDLYVFGMFDSIAGITANKIARFDGYTWHSISPPAWGGGAIISSLIFQNDLYIGGNFYSFPLNAYSLSMWDGSQWGSFGSMFSGGFDAVTCMAVYNGDLYVGGYFNYPNSPGNYIARWDGSTWTQVGGGTNDQVFCMKVFNGELWVGGSFSTAGGISCPCLAKYNGTDWCNVGNFDNTVTAIEEYNGELYVGGGFWTVDGDSVPCVVKWIGGNNTNACGHLNTGLQETVTDNTVQVFPNPAKTSVTFQLNEQTQMFELIITDQLGREVWRGKSDTDRLQLSTEDFLPGIYFYRVEEQGEITASGKLIIE